MEFSRAGELVRGVWPDKWVCNDNARIALTARAACAKFIFRWVVPFVRHVSRCQPFASLWLGAFRSGDSLFCLRACCDTTGNTSRCVLFAKIILSEAVSDFPVGLFVEELKNSSLNWWDLRANSCALATLQHWLCPCRFSPDCVTTSKTGFGPRWFYARQNPFCFVRATD